MATDLFLRDTNIRGGSVPVGAGKYLLTSRGPSSVEISRATTASGTDLDFNLNGLPYKWISLPLSAGFTLSTTDTMTFNIWARESNMSANAGMRCRVWKIDHGAFGNVQGPYDDGVELGTADAAMNWTGNAASNITFNKGDKIALGLYLTNVGTMASGHSGIVSYDGPTGGADGDSWLRLTNNVTFMSEDPVGICKRWQKPVPWARGMQGHPLCPDFAWLLGENVGPGTSGGGGSRFVEQIHGRHGKMEQSDGSWLWAARAGHGLQFIQGQDGIRLGQEDQLLSPSGNTIVVNWRTQAARWTDQIVGRNVTSGALGVRIADSTNNDDIEFCINDQAVSATSSGAYDLNADIIYVFTHGRRGLEVWRDGVLIASSATVQALTLSTDNLYLGAGGGASGNNLAEYGFCFIYKRQLTPAEIQQVTRAPFG